MPFVKPTPEMLLEWARAEAYFEEHKNAVKYRRKEQKTNNSFMKIKDKVYLVTHVILGMGAFSKVKRAFDKEGRSYALKIKTYLPREAMQEASEMEALTVMGRLFGLARRVSTTLKSFFRQRLDHPKDILEKQYTIEEEIEGVTLDQALKAGQYKNATEALILAFRLAQSLCELHDKYGYVHADIKPQNILVSGNGADIKAKFVDFGFSRKMTESGVLRIPQKMGTSIYMAGEITNDLSVNAMYSASSDIYALGVTFGLNPEAILGFLTPYVYRNAKERLPYHEEFTNSIRSMCSRWSYDYQEIPPKATRPTAVEVAQILLIQLKLMPPSGILEHFFQQLKQEAAQQNPIDPLSSLNKMMNKAERISKKLMGAVASSPLVMSPVSSMTPLTLPEATKTIGAPLPLPKPE